MDRVAINFDVPNVGRVFLDMMDEPSGEHPQVIMASLAKELGFEVLAAIPQSIFDGWDFWIRFPGEPPEMPNYFRPVPWKPVGEA